ncbi:MAG: selenocysteine-specific translation elongation factor [Proteobacteria bacterium]|nr:selenocysteine-specific translation elongation factor [Pseudomonadota bacterium]
MKKIVIGTAGHIDHGKTSLIKAITGIDCDRLKEEKDRGITTELGFAHYKFGNDLLLGIVDVPGHEKFIRHMVAGAWGIDMVLLIVAADEGVMPQTREHIDICELLGLSKGIVVITKKDLVDDDMVELVTEDVQDLLKGRLLEGATIIPVSSTTGENLEQLMKTIKEIAAEIQERSGMGIFRLPVDRVFTLKGLGTIVTGTCISGSIKTGEEIEIYPLNKRAKIRNIQTYHEDTAEAIAGERVALNLQGVEKQDIERGTIIGRPGTLILSNRIDVALKYLKLPFKPIKNDSILRFHIATTQEEGRLILFGKDTIEPGEELFAQFVFSNPVVALPDDRFIIRGSYMVQTIGGGKILDITPTKHKRKTIELDSIYNLLKEGTYDDKAEYHILKGGYKGIDKTLLPVLIGKDALYALKLVDTLIQQSKIKLIGKTIVHMDYFTVYKKTLKQLLADFHEKNPLKIGISKEELRMRLPAVEPLIFQTALDECINEGAVETEKDKVRAKSAEKSIDKDIELLENNILNTLFSAGATPPTLKELSLEFKKSENQIKDIIEKLIYKGKVIKLKGDICFHHDIMDSIKEKVVMHLKEKKEMTPIDFRSFFDISRKYMIPILEYLDEIKLTIRVGDKRVLRN